MTTVRRHLRPVAVAVVAAALAIGLAACGGSSGSNSTHATTTATTTAPRPVPAAIHVAMTATNHTPVANKSWHYAVRVTDSAGRPVSATVHAQVVFQGQVVGQIDNGAVYKAPKGRWAEAVTWPPASVGQPLVLQVVVTALGTTTKVNYPIRVASA